MIHRMKANGSSFRSQGQSLSHGFVGKAIGTDPQIPVPVVVETIRRTLLANTMLIPSHLFGAGKDSGINLEQVRRIVRRSSVPARQGEVLFRLSALFSPDFILELGTSVGLGTLYLSLGQPGASVITVEGNRMLAEIADSLFLKHGNQRITLMQCTFEDALQQISTVNLSNALVFVDGDHTYEATLKYFRRLIERAGERCVMVFHDIHWSEDMHRAWRQICSDQRVKATYDLYDMGILCTFGEGDKKDFYLRY